MTDFLDTVKKKWTDIVMCAGKTSDMSGISNPAYQATEVSKKKILKCPTCGFSNVLPDRGVVELPHNYLLQHRLLLSKLNRSDIRLLCDLCQQEVVVCTPFLSNVADIVHAFYISGPFEVYKVPPQPLWSLHDCPQNGYRRGP